MKRKRLSCLCLALILFCVPSVNYADGFRDAESSWARRYIRYFKEEGMISGNGDNLFRPDKPMSLEEMTVLFYSYLAANEPELIERALMIEGTPSSSKDDPEIGNGEVVSNSLPSLADDDRSRVSTEVSKEEDSAENSDPSSADTGNLPFSQENLEDAGHTDLASKTSADDPVSVYLPVKSEVPEGVFDNRWSYDTLSSAYRLGLLDHFILDSNFKNEVLTRNRMHRLLRNYDSLSTSQGRFSEKAKAYRGSVQTSSEAEDIVLAPNQVITRGEALQILYETFETHDLPHNHKVELQVSHISQVTPVYAPVGCEPVSLLMCLRYKGYAKDISIKDYLDKVPRDKDDPEVAFAGSPYTPNNRLRTTIFPKPLADYGRTYGADVSDLSGQDIEGLKKELYDGHPVIAYVTLYWRKPYYRTYKIKGETRTYLRNNHALVVAGYDPAAKKFLVVDPYNIKNIKKKYWVEEAKFKALYEVRKHAVSVR